MNDTFFRVRTKGECEDGVFPMLDSIKERMKTMRDRVDIPEEQTRLLSHTMLFTMRQFVIERIKTPLMKVIILVAKRLPEVNRDNCTYCNTHILLDIQDRFFQYEDNPGREELFRAALKIFIAEYEHDPYYRYRFDWFIEEINKRGWQPRPEGEPSFCWKEENNKKEKHWYII